MNNFSVWRRTTAGKAVSYILCVIFIALSVASAVGCYVMYTFDFYTTSERDFKDSWIYSEVMADGYSIMHHVAAGSGEVDQRYHKDNTNLRFAVYNYNGKFVAGNVDPKFKAADSRWVYENFYKPKKLADNEITIEQLGNASIGDFKNYYTVKAYVAENTGISDIYSIVDKLVGFGYKMRYSAILIGILSFAGALATFVNLMMVSGRRPGSEEIYETFLEKIPGDLLLCGYGLLTGAGIYLACNFVYYDDFFAVLAMGIVVVMAVLIGLWLCMSLSIRIKAGKLLSNTVIWRILRLVGKSFKTVFVAVGKFVRKMPLIWKVLVGLAVFIAIDTFQMICFSEFVELGLIIWGFEIVWTSVLVIYVSFMLIRLKNGGKALAEGDLSYTVDTSKLAFDFKDHGENLNNIAVGMSKAVEDRMRSERMKTELITNVSHDIKNPLTSIISYAGLIADEECNCGKHEEYSKILVEKSEHLKRLLEDIVEISKATTGTLDVELSACRADILLSQLVGEFQERCENNGLELIVSSPEGPTEFLGDSRRIWRIFENMMSNVCKYSMAGSRVYLDVEREGEFIVFVFKNTSKDPLNISVEELKERFVRGDKSRNTDGSGLGLSISDSLMELQKGKMDILIDGDLFKVSLKFKGL